MDLLKCSSPYFPRFSVHKRAFLYIHFCLLLKRSFFAKILGFKGRGSWMTSDARHFSTERWSKGMSGRCHAPVVPKQVRNLEKGAFARGTVHKFVAIACQIMAQIRTKLPAFRVIHQRKGAENCRKVVANSTINFGQCYANTPFPVPTSWNFWPLETKLLHTIFWPGPMCRSVSGTFVV